MVRRFQQSTHTTESLALVAQLKLTKYSIAIISHLDLLDAHPALSLIVSIVDRTTARVMSMNSTRKFQEFSSRLSTFLITPSLPSDNIFRFAASSRPMPFTTQYLRCCRLGEESWEEEKNRLKIAFKSILLFSSTLSQHNHTTSELHEKSCQLIFLQFK